MNNAERLQLMTRRNRLEDELLGLEEYIERVKEIRREIKEIDKRLGA